MNVEEKLEIAIRYRENMNNNKGRDKLRIYILKK